jgi:uncharacterized protein
MLNPASNNRTKEERFSHARSLSMGKIISFTKVWMSSSDFYGNVPYFIALIELDNKEKLVAQVVDAVDELKSGMKVEPCMRKLRISGKNGIIEYGTKFKIMK